MLVRFSFAYGVSQVVAFCNTKRKEKVIEAFCSVRNFLEVVFICSLSLIIRSTIYTQVLGEVLRGKTLHNLLKKVSFQICICHIEILILILDKCAPWMVLELFLLLLNMLYTEYPQFYFWMIYLVCRKSLAKWVIHKKRT